MREIKFRAWNGSLGKMTENFFVDTKGRIYLDSDLHGVDMSGKIRIYPPPNENHFKLMQSTGLKDSKGVEIYEGDVVSHELFLPSVVNFQSGSFFYWDLPITDAPDGWEIIGNIWENPELLPGKE